MLHFSRWKTISVILACLLGLFFAAPNLIGKDTLRGIPDWLPKKQISLGLDLQGGSYLLLELPIGQLTDLALNDLQDQVRGTLNKAKIARPGVRVVGDSIMVKLKDAATQPRALTELRKLIQPLNQNVLTGEGGNNLEIDTVGTDSIRIKLTDQAVRQRVDSVMSAAIETVRKRVDGLGVTEPTIQRQGRDRILIQAPGADDPERLKALLGNPAVMNFHDVHRTMTAAEARATRIPSRYIIASHVDGGEMLLLKRPIVKGEDLVDSQPGFDENNQPAVLFNFNTSGGRKFARHTQNNINRPFAIVIDGKVISAPRIISVIPTGSGQITGNFSVESANDLSIQLRSGSLPVKPEVIEERTVGATLGEDSVAAGKIAGLIGLTAVLVFMLIAYGLFGVFSNIALLANIGMIMGALSMLQATLTLPGIAGIVLTVGMAVDANVLIFERIREELRSGKSPINAIESGYSRALGTILDANITTFIAAVVLFWLGSGPIRGFAVTLSIGILTSVFTAFTVTRLMVSYWLARQKRGSVVVPI
ncbi:MAG: protein translocase subunit SecD [Hyphomicrobiaceae bacterium]